MQPAASRTALLLAGCFGALAVVLGAFAAHAMKEHYSAASLQTFDIGVRYQMTHALALLACALLAANGYRTRVATVAFTVGIVLFSGSLYGLVWTEWRWLGPVTPIGGVAFVVGWLALVFGSRPRG